MEKIIQVLDKNYTSIAFVLKTNTNRSKLTVIFKNEIKIDEIREINLIQKNQTESKTSFDTSEYSINFKLPNKYFKKIINDASSFSDILTINKTGTSPLVFSYTSKDKSIISKHVVQSPEGINLQSNLTSDDIFSSSVRLDYIKPLSNSLLSDFIEIYTSNNKNILFKSFIDNKTIKVTIVTETVKLR